MASIGPPAPDHLPKPPSARIYNVPRLIPAARLTLAEGIEITALAATRTGWARLCRLISLGRLRAQKGSCDLRPCRPHGELPRGWSCSCTARHRADVQPGAGGWRQQAERLTRRFGRQMHLVLSPRYDGQDPERFAALTALAPG